MDHYPGGRTGGLKWEERTEVVKDLVESGFGDYITLSHDHSLSSSALPEVKAHNPDRICFVSRRVLPRLRELGVSQQAITTMTVDAPRRYFGGQ